MDRPDPHRSLANVPTLPERPTYIDRQQVVRFFPNPVVRYLLGAATRRGAIDLNGLQALYQNNEFTAEAMREFYQLLGSSVQHYEDVFPEETPEP
jgi:hypothetical protein